MLNFRNCIYCKSDIYSSNLIPHMAHCQKKYFYINNIINYLKKISLLNNKIIDDKSINQLFKKLFNDDIESLKSKDIYLYNLSKNENSNIRTSNNTTLSNETPSTKIVNISHQKNYTYYFEKYDQMFSNYIDQKIVALIGPAESILLTENGKLIDKFDIIVRLNKSLPLPSYLSKNIGTKTNIIYNSLNTGDFPSENKLSPKLYKKYGVEFICSSYPYYDVFKTDINNYINKYNFDLPLKVYSYNKYVKLQSTIKTRPYTGMSAIYDLLSYNIKLLYISGLDFYQTKYYNDYRVINNNAHSHIKNNVIHQALPQFKFFKYLYLNDDRIIVDKYLENILIGKYDNMFNYLSKLNIHDIYIFCNIDFKNIITNFKNIVYINNVNNIYLSNIKNSLIITPNKNIVVNEMIDKNYSIIINKSYYTNFIGNIYHYNTFNKEQLFYLNKVFIDVLKSHLNKIEISKLNPLLYYIISFVLIFKNIKFNCNDMKSFNYQERCLLNYMRKRNLINTFFY